MVGSRRVPNDPDRRTKILDAALDVVASHGVPRTTHRRIAEQASVPLGSLTYHFDGLDAIIEGAFEMLGRAMSQRYDAAISGARDDDAACAAVADLICGQEYASDRDLTLIYEMYAYSVHNETVAAAMRAWIARSHASLAAHFSPRACLAIDALIEGWPIHRSVNGLPPDRELVIATVTAIAERFPVA